jgi:hypothetical protein
MPKIQQTVTATTTQEIVLKPSVRQKLQLKFKTYAQLKAQRDAIDEKLDALKGDIGAIRDSTGEMSIELDGFKTTLVAGSRKTFDPKRFVAAGGDLDIYNQAIVEKPNRPYEKVTVPGPKKDEEDE